MVVPALQITMKRFPEIESDDLKHVEQRIHLCVIDKTAVNKT